MTDYFANLTCRNLEPALEIRPRLPGRFETAMQAPQFCAEAAPVGDEPLPRDDRPSAADDWPAPDPAGPQNAPIAPPPSSAVEPSPRSAPVLSTQRRPEMPEWLRLNQRLDALWAELNLQIAGRSSAAPASIATSSEHPTSNYLPPRLADPSSTMRVELSQETPTPVVDGHVPSKPAGAEVGRLDAPARAHGGSAARDIVAGEMNWSIPAFAAVTTRTSHSPRPSTPPLQANRPPLAASPRVGLSPSTRSAPRAHLSASFAGAPSPPPQIVVDTPPRAERSPSPATVHVTIGRVEVRAVSQAPAKTAVRRTSPVVTLQQYLRERRGGAS
jgi:hypothetical protein